MYFLLIHAIIMVKDMDIMNCMPLYGMSSPYILRAILCMIRKQSMCQR